MLPRARFLVDRDIPEGYGLAMMLLRVEDRVCRGIAGCMVLRTHEMG